MRATALLYLSLLVPLFVVGQIQENTQYFDQRGVLRGGEARKAADIPEQDLLEYSAIENTHYWKNHPPSPSYFQQDIHYSIAARLAPSRNLLLANMELMYHNNSKETLSLVYFQLPARYKGKQPPVQIRSVRHNGERVRSQMEGNWLKVMLDKPLEPGLHASLEVDFATHFPLQSTPDAPGRDTTGRSTPAYHAWAWYPRIAPYSTRHAWQPQAAYSDFGTYDVRITLPANYIIAATGQLANEDEVLPAEMKEEIGLARFLASSDQHYVSRDSSGSKTWVFQAANVSDFVFIADPLLRRKEVWVGDSIQLIDWVPEPLVGQYRKEVFLQSQLMSSYAGFLGKAPVKQNQVVHGLAVAPKLSFPFILAQQKSALPALSQEMAYAWFNQIDTSLRTAFSTFLAYHYAYDILPDSLKKTASDLQWKKLQEPFLLEALYDSAHTKTMQKDALMLQQLARICGEKQFFRAIQAYLKHWQTAQPDRYDFESFIHQYLGSDLHGFFEAWRAEAPMVDYQIKKLKKLGSGKGNRIRLTLQHSGETSIPLDIHIQTDSGDVIRYHIPRAAYARDEVAESVLLVWPAENPIYETEITLPAPFKRITLDPVHRTTDLNRLNNTHSSPVPKLKVSLLPPKPQSIWDRYLLTIRPNLWWNGHSGLQAGLSLHGHTRARDHQFQLSAWYNSAIGQTQPARFPELVIHPISYRFAYKTPLRAWGKGLDFVAKSAFQDGLQRHAIGLEKNIRKAHVLTQLRSTYHFQRRNRFEYLFYLLEVDSWSEEQNNASLRLSLDRTARLDNYQSLWRTELRSSFIGSQANYAYLEAESQHTIRLFNSLQLRMRGFARYGRGDTPLETQLYRGGGSPEDQFENPFYRARGIFPEPLLNDRTALEPHNLQFAGGLNLRGYAGWHAQQLFRAPSGAAGNVELGVGPLLPKLGSRIEADIYAFYDVGVLGESVGTDWVPTLGEVQQDAGLGITLSGFDGRFFTKEKPLVLRFDMPVWLSHPVDGDEPVQFRWVVGIGKLM